MKIRKWVDMGHYADIEIDADDIRSALLEAFNHVTEDRLGEEIPSAREVISALGVVGNFLTAFDDDLIARMTEPQRNIVTTFLFSAAKKFKPEASK